MPIVAMAISIKRFDFLSDNMLRTKITLEVHSRTHNAINSSVVAQNCLQPQFLAESATIDAKKRNISYWDGNYIIKRLHFTPGLLTPLSRSEQ